MNRSIQAVLAGVGLALFASAASAQVKVTNQGITAAEIVVGTHQDFTGPVKSWGVPIANGMKMAVDDLNAAGGINGRKLRLVVEDAGYDPKKAVLATEKMVERDKIFAMISGLGSPTVAAAEDVLFSAGVLQLFPFSASAFTYAVEPDRPQTRLRFNLHLPQTIGVRAAMKYLIETNNLRKPCLMFQDDELGKDVKTGFDRQLEAMKLTPVSLTSFKRGATDFGTQIARMKSDGCDFIVFATTVRETIAAMGELQKLDWKPVVVGSTGNAATELPVLGKQPVEGFYTTAYMETPYQDTAKGKVKEWMEGYKKTFGTDANTQALGGYNSIMAFAHYAKLAGKDLTGQKMLDALESGDVYQSIFNVAPVKFSKTDHLSGIETQVHQVKNGRWEVIKTGLKF